MLQPNESHVPIRTCIGCRKRRPQIELFRCVVDADGSVRIDRSATGRGAWLCGPECVEPARRRKAFNRAWGTSVRPDTIDGLTADMNG